MPYHTVDDLPATVKAALPSHAQEIYLAVFNRAWIKHSEAEDREEVCHRISWSAVKRLYEKRDGRWVERALKFL